MRPLKTLQKPSQTQALIGGLLFALVAVFLLYGYMVNSTIVNIVERKSAETTYSEVTARISELESQYANLRAEITPQYAQAHGFVEPASQSFVSAIDTTTSVVGAF